MKWYRPDEMERNATHSTSIDAVGMPLLFLNTVDEQYYRGDSGLSRPVM
jgi:hypothetical protein